jgi:hypothetical protein
MPAIEPPSRAIHYISHRTSRRVLTIKKRSSLGWHVVTYQDPDGEVEIQVIPSGRKTPRDPEYAPPIPNPLQLGVVQGLTYASFAG